MSSTGSKRWALLRQALRQRVSGGRLSRTSTSHEETNENAASAVSVRRFKTFGFLEQSPSNHPMEDGGFSSQGLGLLPGTWTDYCLSFGISNGPVNFPVRVLKESLNFDDLLGFNNTGNVCIWPSEEILAVVACCDRFFNEFLSQGIVGKSGDAQPFTIIELGGGMTCLAALALIASISSRSLTRDSPSPSIRVILTDGNPRSVSNLKCLADVYSRRFGNAGISVEARILEFGNEGSYSDLLRSIDLLLVADCFFFDDCRSALAHTINSMLRPDRSMALLNAPERNGTRTKFVEEWQSISNTGELVLSEPSIVELHPELDKAMTAVIAKTDNFDDDLFLPKFVTISSH